MEAAFLYTARFNVMLMGLVFMFVFTAFSTIQVYSSKLYDGDTGSNMLTTLYGVFAVFSFFAPSVTNKLGSRMTMMLGTLGYACVVITGLIYFETGYSDWLIIVGGGLCGVGAALLWTAQGRLILQYSTDKNRGFNFSVFWGLFQSSSIIGGILTWTYFASMGDDKGSSILYIVFLAMVVLGGLVLLLLKAPHLIRGKDVDMDHITRLDKEFSEFSWSEEAAATLRLFVKKEMIILAPLFWYTGFNQPYQLTTYNRFFTKASGGMEMIVFYGAEIIGALAIGYCLDNFRPSIRRHSMIWGQYAFGVIGFALALYHEWDYVWQKEAPAYDVGDSGIILPSFVYFIWGFSDSAVQAYCYWLLGNLYISGKMQARAVGFYKTVQSVGWSIGFVLQPVDRCPPMAQLLLVFGFFLISFPLGWLVAPRDETDAKFAIAIEEDVVNERANSAEPMCSATVINPFEDSTKADEKC
eukprot:Nk52_evm34s252 gene=Nk52_evmTU34s252